MSEPSAPDTAALQAHMVELTRAFGWHRPGSTPCGKPVPIAEAHALLELSKSPGLSQRHLAAALNLRKSTVSRLVSSLEKRRWIVRARSESDRRVFEVSLTDEGRLAAEELAAARQAKMAGIVDRIPEADRSAVLDALQTLIEAIHAKDP